MRCKDCAKLEKGYFCSLHREILKVNKDIRERLRKEFTEEYKWHPDFRVAELISLGATPISLRRFTYAGHAGLIQFRFRYFMKCNKSRLVN